MIISNVPIGADNPLCIYIYISEYISVASVFIVLTLLLKSMAQ